MKCEARDQFLLQARELFFKYGIRSITMDDLAREIRISKKTIYKYVKDKSEVVHDAFKKHIDDINLEIEALHKRNENNAIDEIFAISSYIIQSIGNFHPSIFFDLEKYYPQTLALYEKNKEEHVQGSIQLNLENGLKQGLFREDLNVPLMARIYLNNVDALLQGKLSDLNQFQFAAMYLDLVRYHIRGIASEKGVKYLKEKVKQL